VIVSLFVEGLKLRLPVRDPAWRAAFRLAGPVMLASILGVALVARVGLGLDTAVALLLGAVLAPTDPVLAGAVSVNTAADHDRLRYSLSGEAGLNDGLAFPFVIFALLWGEHGGPGAGSGGGQYTVWCGPSRRPSSSGTRSAPGWDAWPCGCAAATATPTPPTISWPWP
jgi:NhaP-type Na+/H+ or K+/H+ antiporter